MKKSLLILSAFLFATVAFAQEPVIKFYTCDGTARSFTMDEIESISFANTSESLVLKVYQKYLPVENFPVKSVDSLRYGFDGVNRQCIKFSSFGIQKVYVLSRVDSIVLRPLRIGERIWMATNLNVDHYRNGDSIPEVRDPAVWSSIDYGAWCYYNNDPTLGAIYGKLYNREATLDPRGLAPEGWLMPDNIEWDDTINKSNLKFTGTKENGDGFWASPNNGATNESGFSALPGGIRNADGTFEELGYEGYWGKYDYIGNYKMDVSYSIHNLRNSYHDLRLEYFHTYSTTPPKIGFSMRCYKFVNPPHIKSIEPDTIKAGDTVTIHGAYFGIEQRFSSVVFNFKNATEYASWNDSVIRVVAPAGLKNGKLFVRFEDDSSNQIEYYAGMWNYDTVRIGNQTWMLKNLNIEHYRNGDPIPNVADKDIWGNLTSGAWCFYDNDQANEGKYGVLYNQFAANDPRGLAPYGWHVATDEDWAQLFNEMGGDSLAGGKLKATGTIEGGDGLWLDPNTGATNEVGFSALPGGYRCHYWDDFEEYTKEHDFEKIGQQGDWWSASEVNGCYLTIQTMNYDKTKIWTDNYCYGAIGYSVRCVKGNPRPQIRSITQGMLIVGDTLTIKGTAFGFAQDTSQVFFNGINVIEYVSWSDTEIKVKIPSGATSGVLWVTVEGRKSTDFNITIEPGSFKPVQIGYQVWMKYNLDVDHYSNGDSIPQVTDPAQLKDLTTGAWCYYNNDPALGAVYGKLYNWYALNDPRGLAPDGWHLPTCDEWDELASSLGGMSEAGGKLKTIGTIEAGNGLWAAPNTGATNQSGFTALPGGMFNKLSSTWNGLSTDGIWWSTTESQHRELPLAYFWELSNSDARLYKADNYKSNTYSVRCVRNAPPPTINSVDPLTAMIGDTITIHGEYFGPTQGGSIVTFNSINAITILSWSYTAITLRIPAGAESGYLKVRVNGVWSEGFDYTITPGFPEVVKIGKQVWMTSNLNVDHYRNGDSIPEVKDIAQWYFLTTGAWCYYNNDTALGPVYGKLYNWYAVNDPRGLAPEGWHVPTDAEWAELSNSLGGTAVAGGKLKEIGTTHWSFPNTGATNESLFTALPGGCLFNRADADSSKGICFLLGLQGSWWTVTEYDPQNVWYWSITNSSETHNRFKSIKTLGYSVRCIKDGTGGKK